jgi:integrase/recombinase XerD
VVQLWRSNGLSDGTLLIYLPWVRRFHAYCRQRGLDETSHLTLEGALRFAKAYVGSRKGRSVSAQTRLGARNALHAWACALCGLKVSVPPWRPEKPAPRLSPLLAAYCQHRRVHSGVSEATLHRDLETARSFLGFLRARNKPLSRAIVSDVDKFVVHLSKRVSRRTVTDTGSSLRAFFRFLRVAGRLRRDLASCVVTPRIRFAERPPRALPWTDVRRILQSIPQTQPPGKRDHTMLLMMATYGMGAAEVLGLRLDDVAWESEILRVRRPKTGVCIELPLLPSVASSLAAYLRSERPTHAQGRRIFLRRNMPYDPLTSGALRHRIRHYARRAGIAAEVIGAHAFRHSHATRQVDTGANLKVVSDILGHLRPSSTSVYVRVALRRLRTVALPVPR